MCAEGGGGWVKLHGHRAWEVGVGVAMVGGGRVTRGGWGGRPGRRSWSWSRSGSCMPQASLLVAVPALHQPALASPSQPAQPGLAPAPASVHSMPALPP